MLPQTYTCSQGLQKFTVPSGVTRLQITAFGGQGGSVPYPGGLGGEAAGIVDVSEGTILSIIW